MAEWPARLVLVGAGKMGGAMAQGWLEAGLAASSLTILEPNPSPEIASLAASRGSCLPPRSRPRRPTCSRSRSSRRASIQVAPEIAALAAERTLVLSILAGKTIANLEARLPQARAFVRAMPNTPAAIGRGVTAAFANAGVNGEQRRWCERLLGADGSVLLARRRGRDRRSDGDLGRRPGLCVRPDRGARGRGRETGPAGGAFDEPGARHGRGRRRTDAPQGATPPATLRRNVTSPGGTTAAALAVLQGAGRPRGSHGSGGGRGPRAGGRNGGIAAHRCRRRGTRWPNLGGRRRSAYIA